MDAKLRSATGLQAEAAKRRAGLAHDHALLVREGAATISEYRALFMKNEWEPPVCGNRDTTMTCQGIPGMWDDCPACLGSGFEWSDTHETLLRTCKPATFKRNVGPNSRLASWIRQLSRYGKVVQVSAALGAVGAWLIEDEWSPLEYER